MVVAIACCFSLSVCVFADRWVVGFFIYIHSFYFIPTLRYWRGPQFGRTGTIQTHRLYNTLPSTPLSVCQAYSAWRNSIQQQKLSSHRHGVTPPTHDLEKLLYFSTKPSVDISTMVMLFICFSGMEWDLALYACMCEAWQEKLRGAGGSGGGRDMPCHAWHFGTGTFSCHPPSSYLSSQHSDLLLSYPSPSCMSLFVGHGGLPALSGLTVASFFCL